MRIAAVFFVIIFQKGLMLSKKSEFKILTFYVLLNIVYVTN